MVYLRYPLENERLYDKLAGGSGLPGKRVESELRIGDMLDVWKVVDLKENERLLLEHR